MGNNAQKERRTEPATKVCLDRPVNGTGTNDAALDRSTDDLCQKGADPAQAGGSESQPRETCARCRRFYPWPHYLRDQAPADGVCTLAPHAIPVTHDSGSQCVMFELLKSKRKAAARAR